MHRAGVHRRRRLALRASPALRPHDTAAGHAVQAALPPSLAGRILESFVHTIGATLSLAGNRMHLVKVQPIADDACCGRFAFGPAAPSAWRRLDLAAHRVHAVVHGADGRVVAGYALFGAIAISLSE